MSRAVRIAVSDGRPSRRKKDPGILPAACMRSSTSTVSGKKSMPSAAPGVLDWQLSGGRRSMQLVVRWLAPDRRRAGAHRSALNGQRSTQVSGPDGPLLRVDLPAQAQSGDQITVTLDVVVAYIVEQP